MTATAEPDSWPAPEDEPWPAPEASPGPAALAASGVRTLVFDVLGTVVDEAGSVVAQVAAALAAAGVDPAAGPPLAAAWSERVEALTAQAAAGQAPWRSNDALRRAALLDVVQAAGPVAGLAGPALAAVLDDLALAGHRLRAWPDSSRALQTLARSFTVVALSNASLAQLAAMSVAGGLTWHCVLSGDLARAYKPDPAVYRMAIDLLELDPAATMMVAAHPWDLRAAAEHGLRTAYISRPGEDVPQPAEHFDVRASDLGDLAELLTGSG